MSPFLFCSCAIAVSMGAGGAGMGAKSLLSPQARRPALVQAAEKPRCQSDAAHLLQSTCT